MCWFGRPSGKRRSQHGALARFVDRLAVESPPPQLEIVWAIDGQGAQNFSVVISDDNPSFTSMLVRVWN